jgi:hypothetical protein
MVGKKVGCGFPHLLCGDTAHEMQFGVATDIMFQTVMLLFIAAFFVNGALATAVFVLAFLLVDVTVLARRTSGRHPDW